MISQAVNRPPFGSAPNIQLPPPWPMSKRYSCVLRPPTDLQENHLRFITFNSNNAFIDEISSQEVRIEDYLKAYSTTGRPPLPCPQDPVDANQRVVMNLPPLFRPYSERSLTGGPSSEPLGAIQTRPANPAELPDAQAFFTSTVEGEIYHSISAMPRYNAFSPEVRCIVVRLLCLLIPVACSPLRACSCFFHQFRSYAFTPT